MIFFGLNMAHARAFYYRQKLWQFSDYMTTPHPLSKQRDYKESCLSLKNAFSWIYKVPFAGTVTTRLSVFLSLFSHVSLMILRVSHDVLDSHIINTLTSNHLIVGNGSITFWNKIPLYESRLSCSSPQNNPSAFLLSVWKKPRNTIQWYVGNTNSYLQTRLLQILYLLIQDQNRFQWICLLVICLSAVLNYFSFPLRI